ncbi:XRE family transcriptional regulator [Phenylobacterium hankyongense]|uniref:XRE family transcriptional regulator n=1 Tax=Phenylobacterium hankyongense TaxID=1813876 RepID=A0A328B2K9_9CAUL|nr:helix-turn-helix transcriptional regulator [Phenylobacterium hankyongense]RAK60671.1 XRE family transcriptional regulator [Phenylobacterium hankyongense]
MASPIFSEDYRIMIDILVATRRRAGVSQRSLAARLGKSQSHINMIEQRQRRVELREFYLMCKSLGADPVAVFQEITEALEQQRQAA